MSRKDWHNLPLGRETNYESTYNPQLLHPIQRSVSRAQLGLPHGALPFFGVDEWWAFELSWLNPRGKPQVAVARFSFPAESPHMVESKSLKLYLNAFNQSRFESWRLVQDTLARDLSATALTNVGVTLVDVEDRALAVEKPCGYCLDHLDIEVEQYQPDSALLALDKREEDVSETLYSHLLRTNCPVTGQPDWATVVVEYKGPALEREALLAYIISFREHQDFHEHCVERIFCDLQQLADFSELTICARYTRRGGLDINPLRSTCIEKHLPPRFPRQ
ncbi:MULTISPECIES: NADPH-dependent 7-cyano-7-deazaguanine reductase QueF [unclassified Microbulbifer]|uniref:NADPH-dependent 7-cyano-7-deazaguanine reductase n=1 Tax=Microbulbifer spongiae TaxID=2944933 RepID=A0ABY9EH07_9GAMM|nr:MULTISPECIES: NADPH-dependent 7-cyano-7-deazaguanine reductase QueF [unclassified Microbulbifer]MDP5210032.1 NADPH-dependent 7-cyano-7-deazaguanine reductase QueF [Microbulbifer sp. 2205BS26-8]WKD50939.1 NADPH-dependent 7-cyano-7-deazaguanine reductase QueF [Microbulbifer sp. MI-G]